MTAAPRRRRAQRGSGDQLRPEIISVAKNLLAEAANADAVSIRAVADAVGVTAPSIYLHFADKDALIEAVVIDVFAELDVAMVAAGDLEAEPLARLRAYGLAYVQFAIEHPEHYRVATMDPSRGAQLGTASHLDHVLAESCFAHFVTTVVSCMDAGVFTQGDPAPVALELWTAAHGVAALMVAKPTLPWGDKLEFASRVLRSAAIGHALNDHLGGQVDPPAFRAWLASV